MSGRENEGRVTVSPKNVSLRILIFIALALLTALALRPLQLTLQNRMKAVKENFIRQTEEFLGRKIQYDSIGPSLFGAIEIRNVLILRDDDSVFLNISRLRLSYSIVQFLRGNLQDVFQSMRIDRPILNLDFQRDKDLFDRFASLGTVKPEQQSTFNFAELFPEKFTFRIWNGEWDISDPLGSFSFRNVGLDVSVRQSRLNFQGRWNAGISVAGVPFLDASVRGKINGDYSTDTGEGSASVTIPSFAGDSVRLRPLGFNLLLSGSILELRKTHDRTPSALSLVYNFNSNELKAGFEAENFSPNAFLTFQGRLADFNPVLATRISGKAGIEKRGSESLQFNIDFSGSGPQQFPGHSFLEQAKLAVNINGNLDRLKVNALNFHSSKSSLDFYGGIELNSLRGNLADLSRIAPYGTLTLSNFAIFGDQGISGVLALETYENEISVFAENLSSGAIKLSAIDLSVFPGDDGLDFTFSALRFKENERMGSFFLSGSMDYFPRQVQANLRLDSFTAGDVLCFIEPVAIVNIPAAIRSATASFAVTTEVFLTTDFEQVLYNAPRIVAAYEGVLNVLAAASLSGTDRGIELSTSRISWDNGSLELSGSVDFSRRNDTFFSLGLSYRNLTYFFDGTVQDGRNVNIRGSYGFQVSLNAGFNGAYSGYASGDSIPIPSGERYASLSFLFSLNYNSPAVWQAAIEKFQITGLSTPSTSFASLSLNGRANERGLVIPNLLFDDGRGALSGEINLNWDSSYKFCGFRADIAGSNYGETYYLEGMYRDELLELSLAGRRMQLSHFSSRNGVLDGSFTLSWASASSFFAKADISSFALYHQNEVVRISANAHINENELLAERLRINFSGLEASVPVIRIDRSASIAETEAFIWGMISKRPLDIVLKGEASFGPSNTWIELFKNLGFLDGTLTLSTARFDDIVADEPFKFIFNVRQEDRAYSVNLNGGPRNMLRAKYTPEAYDGGIFSVALSAPSPVRGTFSGFINSENIDAQWPDLYVDMGALWRFVPVDVITFPGGIVNASLRVAGSMEEPEFFGSARGRSLQIMVPDFIPEPIRPVPVTVLFNGTDITFGPIDAFVGNGKGIASAWFRFDQWIPNIFSIDIAVPQETPIPYDFGISGVLANGNASGDVNLAMEDLVLSVTGGLVAHDTAISLDYNELVIAMEGGQNQDVREETISTVIDLSIKTGRRVEFFWPSVDFPILQANADLGTGIHVTSDIAARRFSLNGDVQLRSGEIFYLERNFYIKEGTLFFRESEVQFDPRISARAEIRDQADAGPVIISMIIDYAPLREFSPRFVSTPPLSQLEIYSILGQNMQGEGEQRNLATSAVIDSLAQFTVIRRLQRQLRDFLGLDMLSVRTQLLQNMVLQVTGGQFSGSNLNDSYRVGNYFDNTTIFIGKFIGAELFGEAMLSFKYDENKLDWGGMVIEPELGLEMRNPLFDIRFNMNPLHPENMFIDDVSFSFTWRRSF